MECRTYERMISRLVDGELPTSASEELGRHLSACPECSRVYQRMSALNRALGSIEPAAPKATLVERVKARVSDQRRTLEAREAIPSWYRVPLMAMVVLLALGLGNLAGRSVSQIIGSAHPEQTLEWLTPDQGQSFADVVIELGSEENAR